MPATRLQPGTVETLWDGYDDAIRDLFAILSADCLLACVRMPRPYGDPVEIVTGPVPAQSPFIPADAKIVVGAVAPASPDPIPLVLLPGFEYRMREWRHPDHPRGPLAARAQKVRPARRRRRVAPARATSADCVSSELGPPKLRCPPTWTAWAAGPRLDRTRARSVSSRWTPSEASGSTRLLSPRQISAYSVEGPSVPQAVLVVRPVPSANGLSALVNRRFSFSVPSMIPGWCSQSLPSP